MPEPRVVQVLAPEEVVVRLESWQQSLDTRARSLDEYWEQLEKWRKSLERLHNLTYGSVFVALALAALSLWRCR